MPDKNPISIVIIGWNERAKKLTEILASISHVKIYIIDNSLLELPFMTKDVVLIKGDSMNDSVLQEAGVKQTGLVFITADMHTTEHDSDSRSIITLLAIKSLSPSAFTVVEILSNTNIHNAKRAGADEVIYTSKIFAGSVISSILKS